MSTATPIDIFHPNRIDVTGRDLVRLVQNAYALTGITDKLGLSEDDAKAVINTGRGSPINAHSINGYAVQLHVYEFGGHFYFERNWPDHDDERTHMLMESIGILIFTSCGDAMEALKRDGYDVNLDEVTL